MEREDNIMPVTNGDPNAPLADLNNKRVLQATVKSIESMGYSLERLSRRNLADAAKLYGIIHSKPHPAGFFEKKYDTAYTGAEYLGFIAYNKYHLPIACYAVVPCFIKYNEQLILAAQSADTMTHPNYRYKGLFVQLANLTAELCVQSGVRVIFGLPNQIALHGFLIKLQWQLTETMNCFTIPVNFISLEKLFARLKITRGFYSAYKRRVLKKYLAPKDSISNSVVEDGYAGVYRDDKYLDYKTSEACYFIRIRQTTLWIKINNKLIIGDITGAGDDFDQVISILRKLALKLGVSRIEFHTCHETRLCALLSKRYNATPSFHILFKDLGAGIPLDKIKFTYADIDFF